MRLLPTVVSAGVATLFVSQALMCWAQSAGVPPRLTFDVVSVRLTMLPVGVTVMGDSIDGPTQEIQRLKRTGGPGTSDPGRIHYPLVTLRKLLDLAWDGSYFEIKSPEWADIRTVAVDATMPVETTREQLHEMLRNFLIDRFKLKYHVEESAGTGSYYLVTQDGALKKMPVEIIVIDHLEKTPTDN